MFGDSRLNNLDEVYTSFCRTPLHIAVMCDDIEFPKRILSVRPDLASKEDKQGFTPLHLASARPSLQMVKLLLKARPGACVAKDKDGRTPLHLAVMKDRVEIMKALMEEKPDAVHVKNDENGETILHFCVKNNDSFTTLKLLVDKLPLARNLDRDTAISIDSKDNDGNTIVNYLLHSNNIRIDIDAINKKGLKALDVLSEAESNDLKTGFYNDLGHNKELTDETLSGKKDHKQVNKKSQKKRDNAERVNALLVVATLIGQIAFQAALNPPGGVWQDDLKVDSKEDPVKFYYYILRMFGSTKTDVLDSNDEVPDPSASLNTLYFIEDLVNRTGQDKNTMKGLILQDFTGDVISFYNSSEGGMFFPYLIRYAGFPIMAYKNPELYGTYMLVNTVAFSLSLTIVFAVICGFVHDKSVAQNRILVMLLCISIGCISIGYLVVLESLVPYFFLKGQVGSSVSIYFVLCCICGIGLLLWRLLSRMVKLQKKRLTPFNYLKALFRMDASAAGKVVLLIFGICAVYFTSKVVRI
ncbi:hypothetical protein MKW98_000923 [Papaver atlanticum]|uniref:PGG domain-containing protein n=1 Tax=Papaver atlanticum TaxID=357466 RepID=A0AAD4XDG4_9MAGN|nr:hypothetical protein MKW98_000923 [Papaver atlanticum]